MKTKIKEAYDKKMTLFGLMNWQEQLNWKKHAVKVRLFDIGWLYAGENEFLDFINILDNVRNKELYLTNFVKALLDVFWVENKNVLIWSIFIPYLIYLTSTVYFVANVVCVDIEDREPWEYSLAYFNAIITFYMIYIEII